MQNEIEHATEVFARGLAVGRSFTYPSEAARVGKLWVIRDEPRKSAAHYRREEWTAVGVSPVEMDKAARAGTRGRFCVCAICPVGQVDGPLREGYRALGYRLHASEAIMLHRLKKIPRTSAAYPIQRVLTESLAAKVAKASGRRQILPEHLKKNASLRLYTALDDGHPIGWAKSIVVGDACWVSNVHVLPSHRRRGVGQSLMAKMLKEDRASGSRGSFLTASHAGAFLYDTMGYELLGHLLLFTPRRI